MDRQRIYIKEGRPGRGKAFVVASLILAVGFLAVWVILPGPSKPPNKNAITVPDASLLHTPVMPHAGAKNPPVMSAELTLGRGENLGTLLRRSGARNIDMPALIAALSSFLDLKNLKVGQKLRVFYDARTHDLRSVIVPLDVVRYVELKRTKKGYVSTLKRKKTVTSIVSFACMIRYSFHRSLYNCGADAPLASTVEAFLARRIDLFRQVRRGDVLRLIIEKISVSGRFLKYGRILALTYTGRVVNESAFYFKGMHYDRNGESFERPFLPSPLQYAKVKWGKVAYKQSKKKHRLSIEYSVPSQTQVFAVGDGKVLFSGRDIRLGRQVILQHQDGYRSYYARLASIAKGVRVGTMVQQGQVIGRVGRHPLYFAVSRNGIYRKPSVLGKIQGTRLDPGEMAAFKSKINKLIKQLQELPVRNSYGP